MTYAVLGVTGNTGKVVAETLLAQGKQVRVVVRDRAKAAAFAARGAEVAVADLTSAEALAEAFRGVEGAYALVPPSFTPEFKAYQRATADVIAAAAEQSKLPHLVLLSSWGAQLPAGTGPIAGLYYAEQQLRKLSATRSSFLRAAYFIENIGSSLGALESGVLPSFFKAQFAQDMIATHDIGTTAAMLLVEGAAQTQVVDLAGPRASFADIAATFSKLLNKPIQVAEVPPDAAVPTLRSFGVPDELAGLYHEMFVGIQSGHIALEPGHRKIQGKTDLETALRGLLGK
jgi:uncharacterized protein YbjT (DUF2867 family)